MNVLLIRVCRTGGEELVVAEGGGFFFGFYAEHPSIAFALRTWEIGRTGDGVSSRTVLGWGEGFLVVIVTRRVGICAATVVS